MQTTGLQNYEVFDHIAKGGRLERPAGCPPEVYELMRTCWAKDPAKRPAFEEIQCKMYFTLSGAAAGLTL